VELVRRRAKRSRRVRTKLAAFEKACVDIGRDPKTVGKSAGIIVEPTSVTGAADALGKPIQGSAEEIADGFRAFEVGGFMHLELLLWPRTMAALEAIAPVLNLLDSD